MNFKIREKGMREGILLSTNPKRLRGFKNHRRNQEICKRTLITISMNMKENKSIIFLQLKKSITLRLKKLISNFLRAITEAGITMGKTKSYQQHLGWRIWGKRSLNRIPTNLRCRKPNIMVERWIHSKITGRNMESIESMINLIKKAFNRVVT